MNEVMLTFCFKKGTSNTYVTFTTYLKIAKKIRIAVTKRSGRKQKRHQGCLPPIKKFAHSQPTTRIYGPTINL